ncbi:MAG TPA: acetyl-CoA carboxylase biotin carboxylase subunit [Methylocystis sp.]|jgi:3-methylcrotonyl-CoA carboxylase alpha subunit
MFRKALIANRGEIACRIARTARAMEIATVAVYSDADDDALHVRVADEAFRIGPAPARESYLSIERILDAARRSGADAIHPGYGFLSENADFAERCVEAGIAFIGPPARAMRLMGSKAEAKELMAQVGAPVLPGYHGEAQDAATLRQAAKRIGFPVLVKASAGGGGRGMRVVSEPHELDGALESARREALGAFGNDRLLIEKLLSRPRHVEIQLFADSRGGVVTFPERDCSLQRRRQKIVEETPAPGLASELRTAMRAAATKAALASSYIGAGTVEFLVQNGAFYFLEMNTRLQVEHPVTEMISGLDLVEWQFRVAAGESLPLAQEEIDTRGCAIEARICAENPAEGFIPATGRIAHLRLPQQGAHLRIDSGVAEGDRISSYYDSLLAKLIVWGEGRADAVARLRRALESFALVGVATNLDFLRELVGDPHFAAGEYDTGFVDAFQHSAPILAPEDENWLLAAAAAGWFSDILQSSGRDAGGVGDPWSPADGWRLFGQASCAISFLCEGRTLSARLRPRVGDAFQLETAAETIDVRISRKGAKSLLFVNGVGREVAILPEEKGYTIIRSGKNHYLERLDPLVPRTAYLTREEILTAPLPARVIRIFVQPGAHVRKGEQLLVLEAMKMEITITAPRDGEVEIVSCAEGEAVPEGAVLMRLAEAS